MVLPSCDNEVARGDLPVETPEISGDDSWLNFREQLIIVLQPLGVCLNLPPVHHVRDITKALPANGYPVP
jgi:hypothetical protein